MDRLVSTEWLEKELGASDLRLLDCTVPSEVLPGGGINYRSGRHGWERSHIPQSSHLDLLERPWSRRTEYLIAEAEGISMQEAARRAVRDYVARGQHRNRVRAAAERITLAHAEALERLGR